MEMARVSELWSLGGIWCLPSWGSRPPGLPMAVASGRSALSSAGSSARLRPAYYFADACRSMLSSRQDQRWIGYTSARWIQIQACCWDCGFRMSLGGRRDGNLGVLLGFRHPRIDSVCVQVLCPSPPLILQVIATVFFSWGMFGLLAATSLHHMLIRGI